MGSEANTRLVLDLLRKEGNDICADCGATDPPPDWASVNIGIFVCLRCSGIHRGLSRYKSTIKSVRLDRWSDDSCKTVAEIGNIRSNQKWEKNVPFVWDKPQPDSHDALIKEWIHAKYDRQEFLEGNEKKQTYLSGNKQGTLFKRERYRNNWNSRWFALCSETQKLSYYEKREDLQPIKRIDVTKLNVVLCDDTKTGKANSMQLCETVDGQTRSYYVYANNTSHLIDWYLCIRSARYKCFNISEARHDRLLISAVLSHDFIMEGYLEKTGPKDHDGWKKRWISLDVHRLLYFEDKLESIGKEVVLGPEENGFTVEEGMVGKHSSGNHCFVVKTPKRIFNFRASTREDLETWMKAFKKSMEPFPSLQAMVKDRLDNEKGLARLSIASYISDDSNFSSSSD